MTIEQGEIWEIEFFPNVGSEIGKKRPALVVNHDSIGRLPLKTIVPITEWKNSYAHYPWMIKILSDQSNGLSKMSAIDCFQIRNFSNKRFKRKLGHIDQKILWSVHTAILKTLNPGYRIL